jgi:hypothetical protein
MWPQVKSILEKLVPIQKEKTKEKTQSLERAMAILQKQPTST